MRQQQQQQHQQRKITPQYQEYEQAEGEATMEGGVEWEEFEIENIVSSEDRSVVASTPAKHENGYKEGENGHKEGEKKKKKSK